MHGFTRRDLLGSALLAGGALLIGSEARAALEGKHPFSLGVASGEPAPDGMVLWTRLAPEPLLPDGGMPPQAVPVRWEISEDPRFAKVVSGTAMAEPEWGHSVHVEVTGLKPGRPYWYRFIMAGEVSPVGRTRTAPAAGAVADRLRLCFGSCQKFESGHYAAWRHVVAEDPDLILFLGDYIYEGDPSGKDVVRRHLNPRPKDVGGYRVRYATYKGDPLLQAAHQAAPWIVTWDDHEVENNYTGDHDRANSDPAAFLRLRAAAYQAYYEHMPLRRNARPAGPFLQLYRTVDWGGLAQFQVIDDRQFRPSPPCQAPDAVAKHVRTEAMRPDCAERRDPASMLGLAQESWLLDRLGTTRAKWNMLAQQTLMMPFKRFDPDHPENPPSMYDTDEWEGYPVTRERIVRRWRDAKTPNPVVLSGDIHSFAAGDMDDPDKVGAIVASEFVGGSITSTNDSKNFKPAAALDPHFHFAENFVRGYGRIDVTAGRCDVAFRGLADALDPASAVRDLARFTVENGRAGIQSG